MCGSRPAPRMCCSDDCWDLRTRICRCVDTAVVPELSWAITLITLCRLPEASVFPVQLTFYQRNLYARCIFLAVHAIAASNHWWAFSGRYRGNRALLMVLCNVLQLGSSRPTCLMYWVLGQWYSPQIVPSRRVGWICPTMCQIVPHALYDARNL